MSVFMMVACFHSTCQHWSTILNSSPLATDLLHISTLTRSNTEYIHRPVVFTTIAAAVAAAAAAAAAGFSVVYQLQFSTVIPDWSLIYSNLTAYVKEVICR